MSKDAKAIKQKDREYLIVADLGKSDVAGKEPRVWPGFRIFEAVPPRTKATKTGAKRRLNAVANPLFDFTNDTLFDYGSIIAHKLGRTDWESYNRLCSVHTPTCPFHCWHCYNDAWPDAETGVTARKHSASEIFAFFEAQHKFDHERRKSTNVVRVTGGEPFTEPWLIVELAERIAAHNQGPEAVPWALWTETNLHPFMHGRDTESRGKWIAQLAQHRGCVVVHPCLHGLDEDEVESITGCGGMELRKMCDALEQLVLGGIDVYPTIHGNLCNPAKLVDLFDALSGIHSELPLRVAVIEVDLRYAAVERRMRAHHDKGNRVQLWSRHAALYEWDRILRRAYGVGYGVVPRHLISLDAGKSITGHSAKAKREENPDIDTTKTSLLVLKSSMRDAYRQQSLSVLGLPPGFLFAVPYDDAWISQDISQVGRFWPEAFKGEAVSVCYGEMDGLQPYVLPLRAAECQSVDTEGKTVTITYRVQGYPKAAVDPKCAKGNEEETCAANLAATLWDVFGERTIPPTGSIYAILGPSIGCLSEERDDPEKLSIAWQNIVDRLSQMPRLHDALFCRLSVVSGHQVTDAASGGEVRSALKAGINDIIKIRVRYRMPSFHGIATGTGPKPTLRVEVTDPDLLAHIGPEEIPLAKYGDIELHFRCGAPDKCREAHILIWRSDDPTNGPSFRIPVRISVGKKVSGNAVCAVLGFVTMGAGGLVGGLLSGLWKENSSFAPQAWSAVWSYFGIALFSAAAAVLIRWLTGANLPIGRA